MFKKKGVSLAKRQFTTADADTAEDEVSLRELKDIQELQKERAKRKGIPNMPEVEEEEEENSDDEYGLLESKFGSSGSGANLDEDKHLKAFLAERLDKKKIGVQAAEVVVKKSRVDELYEMPEHLAVPDAAAADADKMNWLTGLVEVDLGLDAKIENIERTEDAKRKLMNRGASSEDSTKESPDEFLVRRAFGARFTNVREQNAQSKRSTDDLVLDRFRKRQRRQ